MRAQLLSLLRDLGVLRVRSLLIASRRGRKGTQRKEKERISELNLVPSFAILASFA